MGLLLLVSGVAAEGEDIMAKLREEVCLYYIAFGQCQKGREASQKGYCQKCSCYVPRSRNRHLNKKKQELQKVSRMDQLC